MEMLNNIIEKLKQHLLNHMGFVKTEDGLSKKLSIEDYCLSKRVIRDIMEGKAYKGADPYVTIQSILIDNYVGEKIMDTAIYELHLTQEEEDFIFCEDDEDDDDFGYNGYTEIESWVTDQNICVDRNELKAFIAAAM